MWKKLEEVQPPIAGIYNVFGKVNEGSEYEEKCRFIAKWQDGEFCDLDGEKLTSNYDNISHWFDFSKIDDPECNCVAGETCCYLCTGN